MLSWIKSQHVKGATIVGVCSGARVLSRTGLLEGRAATGHWYDLEELRKDNPSMRWVADRRYVADRGVVTTTGITASVPVSLALVEAIGGRARAEALAHELDVAAWEAGHDSKAFGLDRGHVSTAVGNTLAFWSHQTLAVPVESGVDEIALAFAVDAYSRTYRSQAVTVSRDGRPLRTRRGLELLARPVGLDGAGEHGAGACVGRGADAGFGRGARRYRKPLWPGHRCLGRSAARIPLDRRGAVTIREYRPAAPILEP